MALSNALFAGLSGLDVNQVKLNVVGNNIANVNTVAFKSTRTLFKPQFYVTDSGGSQPTGENGGTNPSQRGLGAGVASLDRDFSTGSIESTGRSTDMAIDGDGFFIVKSDEQKYTRDGSFKLNPANQLVTTGGDFVQGYGVDEDFNIMAGELSQITIPEGALTTAQATTKVKLSGNLNADGPIASGASILTTQLLTRVSGGVPVGGALLTDIAATSTPASPIFSVGQALTLDAKKGQGGSKLEAATFTVAAGSTLDDLMTFLQNNLGINTAVPDDGNPATPAPGVVREVDAVDVNSVRIVVAGNLGAANALSIPAPTGFQTAAGISPLAFDDGTNAAGISSDAVGESARQTTIIYDSLGTPITIDVTAVLESKADTGNLWRFFVESPDSSNGQRAVGTGTLLFDNQGRLLDSSGTTVSIPRAGTGAVTPLVFDLNVNQLMGLTDQGNQSTLTPTPDDGSAIGTLTSFNIGDDGVITGSFSNGVTRTLGQLAIATFSNPQGLIDRGGSMFAVGANSGSAIIGTPGTLGAGKIVAGALELSNVDLSEEFINLIIASTGFSAASRVISTSDQLISELLNTSR